VSTPSGRSGQPGVPGGQRVLVLNGPNLGRLGTREPGIYGATTHVQLAELCVRTGKELGLDVEVRQTDHEGEMVGWLHEAADSGVPVVLNAGAWTHYSIAVRDACAMLTAPLVEVHISNVHTREEFRHHNVVSAVATGVIVGLGIGGYSLALRWIAEHAVGTRQV
jgi:3-dehydroquinate dehydratase II